MSRDELISKGWKLWFKDSKSNNQRPTSLPAKREVWMYFSYERTIFTTKYSYLVGHLNSYYTNEIKFDFDVDVDNYSYTIALYGGELELPIVAFEDINPRKFEFPKTDIGGTEGLGGVSEKFTIEVYRKKFNAKPSIIIETDDNQELFEGGKITLNGTVSDPDLDDIVTVKYQVNNSTPKNIKAFVSQGTVEEYFKTLTYKDGSLYDGNNLILGNMLDGEHKVSVWAEDNNGGKSDVEIRNFTTKRNRYPVVEVIDYPKSLSNLSLLNELEFKFNVTDPDEGNTVTGSYTLNNGERIPVVLDEEGNGEFKLSLADLKDGVNIVEIIGTDNYDFDTIKKVKLDVTLDKFKPKSRTYRYELLPDSDLTSHGIVSWVKHRTDTNVKLSYSTDKLQGFHDMNEEEVTSPTGMKETEFSAVFDDPANKVYLELKDAQNATLIMGGVDTDEPSED